MLRTLVALATISLTLTRPIYPSNVRTCSHDADCQVYGDRNAVCTSGLCTCDAGYDTLTATAEILSGPSTYYNCFANGATVAQEMAKQIEITITINFPTGDCTRTAELTPLFDAAVEATIGTGRSLTSYYTCPTFTGLSQTQAPPTLVPTQAPPTPAPPTGQTASPTTPAPARAGIFVSLVISGTVQDLFTGTFINFDINVLRLLDQVSVSILSPPPQWLWWMYESQASFLLCDGNVNDNAVIMAHYGSPETCRSASCASIAPFNPDTGKCDRNTFSQSDDGLSDSALAGIICGSVIGAVLIGLLIYCCVCRRGGHKDEEEVEEEEEGKSHGNPDDSESSSS